MSTANKTINRLLNKGSNSQELRFFQVSQEKFLSNEEIKELKPLLNSQRIKRLFGSYGVDVLHQDDELRISNLHSFKNESTIMRTCAIVNYCLPVAASLEDAHNAILKGGSIGATLKKNGFSITKQPIYFGETNLPIVAKKNMDIDSDSAAVHIYCLWVSNEKNAMPLEYYTIIEIHSPKYLTSQSLAKMYPEDYMKHNEINDKVIKPHLDKIKELDSILSDNPVLK